MRRSFRPVVGGVAGIACGLFALRGAVPLPVHAARTVSPPPATRDSLPKLIPIEALFDSPAMEWGGISPDGKWLSYLKRWHGHQNVFVRHIGSNVERLATRDSVRSIPTYWWSADGKRILWLQDRGGDENYHLFASDIADTTLAAAVVLPCPVWRLAGLGHEIRSSK